MKHQAQSTLLVHKFNIHRYSRVTHKHTQKCTHMEQTIFYATAQQQHVWLQESDTSCSPFFSLWPVPLCITLYIVRHLYSCLHFLMSTHKVSSLATGVELGPQTCHAESVNTFFYFWPACLTSLSLSILGRLMPCIKGMATPHNTPWAALHHVLENEHADNPLLFCLHHCLFTSPMTSPMFQ